MSLLLRPTYKTFLLDFPCNLQLKVKSMKKVQNKPNKVEVVFVLDRSGSMENVVSDTIGGFNSMINKQKKEIAHIYRQDPFGSRIWS